MHNAPWQIKKNYPNVERSISVSSRRLDALDDCGYLDCRRGAITLLKSCR